jgi:plasmid stability protein
MDIAPIKTRRDYRHALKRIERLMTAKRGTPEGDCLDVLVTLVEAWERRHYPLDFPDPVAVMERRMAGNLHVRNLDDDLIARLKRRAARHGRSTEAEHREILRQALIGDVEPSFDTLAADLRKLTKRRKQTPSEVLLREGREER